MTLPTPPGSKLNLTLPDKPEDNGLTDDAIAYVMDQTLRIEHREDPYVIKFINSYIACRDVKQASAEAGIHSATGKKLLNRRDVSQCIVKLTDLVVHKYGYTAEEVVERVREIANLDIAEVQDPDTGEVIKNLHNISPEVRRCIKKIKAKNTFEKDPNGQPVVTGEIIEIEFYDKTKQLELLGREKKLFKETKVTEHGVTEQMADVLLGAAERAEKRRDEALKGDVVDVTPGGDNDGGSG